MSAMSDYLENKLVDHIFRNTQFTMPSTIYIGLYTAAPSDSSTGSTGGTEVTAGANYARIQVGPSTSTWTGTHGTTTGASSGTGGLTDNAAQITFGTPSASWGTITHFGIFDALTAGNLLFWGALTASKTVNNGDPAPYFAAGALDVTFA